MKGMRIKNHKNSYTNQNYRNEKYVRYTPIGAIRLLPPVAPETTQNITLVPRPAAANTGPKSTKTTKGSRSNKGTKRK